MANKPIVSVIIPTYNHAHLITRALNSIINQTFSDWEAIVVNNYSEDDTESVVNQINDSRIKLFNYRNHGVIASSRNYGIKQAQGKYVAFLDSDDTWSSDKLLLCVSLLDQGYDLVGHGMAWIDKGIKKRDIFYGPERKARYASLLFNGNCLSPSSTIVTKQALESVDCFSESVKYITAEDYDLWLKLAQKNYKFYFLKKILGQYHTHNTNQSKNVILHMQAENAVIENHFSMLTSKNLYIHLKIRKRRALVLYRAARGYQLGSKYKQSLIYFARTWILYPFIARIYPAVVISAFKLLSYKNK